MKKAKQTYYILFFFYAFITSMQSQNTVGIINNTTNAYHGYTLFTNHTTTYLINNCGEVINQWTSNYIDGKSVYLLEDGSILRAGVISNSNFSLPGIGGVIQKIDWDGNLLWEYQYSSSNFSQHHDMYPLPNGNVLILAVTKKSASEAFQAGRNPSLLDADALYNEQIIEVQPTGLNTGNIVWEWNVWDHLIQDFDSTKDNFGVVSENPQLLDINYLGVSVRASNWMHVNSIQYNEALDQIIFSARQMNEIYIIDHSTTTAEAASHTGGTHNKGGDFLYRWGNPVAYKQGQESDQKLFGQHTPHWISEGHLDEGKILLFNNGNGRTSAFSSVDIINPEKDSNGNYISVEDAPFGPETFYWTYTATNPTDFFSRIMSSAQRLPNGNTLICDSDSGYFFEIDGNNTKVWEYINPQTTNGTIFSQGDAPESNLTFRAYKYAPDYPAFNGRDLTPGNPIELNPDLSNCNLLSVPNLTFNELQISPNPTRDLVQIQSSKKIDKVEVYNLLGKNIKTEFNSATISFAELNSGVYILKVYCNNSVFSKKVIKS